MAQPKTDASGQIVPRTAGQDRGKETELHLVKLVSSMGAELQKALPKHVTPDRMSRIVVTALRTTPHLAECTIPSFLGCIFSLAQLGLEPNTPLGHAYLIPRWNKDREEYYCSLIIGYQGMLDLSFRSGFLESVDVDVVKDGDHFVYERGFRPKLEHRYADDPGREQKKTTHAWAIFRIRDSAFPPSHCMNRAQIEGRRRRSASPNSGPWVTDYDAMAKKTVIRDGWKWIPKSSEMARAVALDEAPEVIGGKPQLAAADPMLLDVLRGHGLDVERELREAEGEAVEIDAAAAAP
jgi:recombination protein RecT